MGVTVWLILLVSVNCYFFHKSTAQSLVQENLANSECPNFEAVVDGLRTDMAERLGRIGQTISGLNEQLVNCEDTKSTKIDDAKFTVAFPYISPDTIEIQMSPKSRYYITTYDVSYTKGDGATVHRKKVDAERVTKVALTSLESGSEYLINIQAYQRNTERVLGGPVKFRVSTDEEEPTLFRAKMKNASCCSILLVLESISTSSATHYDISYSSKDQKMVSAGTVQSGPRAEFEIKSLKADTTYNIDVTAFNKDSLGFIGNPVTLEIRTLPPMPKVTVLSSTHCSLHLGLQMIQPINVTRYSVILTDIHDLRRHQINVEAVDGISQTLFANLRENREFKVEVVSYEDKPSRKIDLRTVTTKPMVSDVAILPLVIQSSSVILELHFAPALKADGYTFKFLKAGSSVSESKSQMIFSEISSAEFRMTHLQPQTTYLISVDATADGETVASSNTLVTTSPQIPTEAPVVKLGRISDHSFELLVNPQPHLNVTGFKFTRRTSTSDEFDMYEYYAKPDGSWEFDLYSHTPNYTLCVGVQALRAQGTPVGRPYPFCGRTEYEFNLFA